MKVNTNKKYNTIAFYAAIVIAINVLLIVAILKINSILEVLSAIVSVFTPIIWGIVIAFLINPIMTGLEKLYRKWKEKPHKERVHKQQKRVKAIKNKISQTKFKQKKGLRAATVTISAIIFVGIVAGIIYVIVPEIINSTNNIIDNFSSIVASAQTWISKLFANYPDIGKFLSEKLIAIGTDLTKIQPMLENILSGAIGFVNVVKNFVLGLILSIYILFNKENLFAQIRKIMYALFKKTTCQKLFNFSSQANKTFSGFFIGKIIDSFIIGVICFIILTILNMPYNILISVVIGVTNIIPFFGPFIGAIPSGVLILLVEPRKIIWFIVVMLLLQTFDGYILGPKILGGSTGLPAIWVMVSLFIGAGLFGFVGMLISVPAFALIYSFVKSGVENKLIQKNMHPETSYYLHNDYPDEGSEHKKAPTAEELKKLNIPSIDEANEAAED